MTAFEDNSIAALKLRSLFGLVVFLKKWSEKLKIGPWPHYNSPFFWAVTSCAVNKFLHYI